MQPQTYRHPYPPLVAKAPSDSHTARMSLASTHVSFAAFLTARMRRPFWSFEYLYSSSTANVNGFSLLDVHTGPSRLGADTRSTIDVERTRQCLLENGYVYTAVLKVEGFNDGLDDTRLCTIAFCVEGEGCSSFFFLADGFFFVFFFECENAFVHVFS